MYFECVIHCLNNYKIDESFNFPVLTFRKKKSSDIYLSKSIKTVSMTIKVSRKFVFVDFVKR